MANDDALELTYDGIKSLAEMANPTAAVRINLSGHWEIYIPTFTRPATTLPASFNGTPAAELVREEGFEALRDWAKHQTLKDPQYMECLPLEGLAEYYNFNHQREVLLSKDKTEVQEQGVSEVKKQDAQPDVLEFSGQAEIPQEMTGEFMNLNIRWLPLV